MMEKKKMSGPPSLQDMKTGMELAKAYFPRDIQNCHIAL